MKRPLILCLALVSSLASGCVASLNLPVLQPAEVYVPADIQTIVVIDRSRAVGAGQGALSVLEGLATGEGIGVDRAGRQAATDGAVKGLQASPRFDAVLVPMDRKAAESDLLDSTMSWKAAAALCKEFKCDAIVALEALDSDTRDSTSSRTQEEQTEDGRTVKKVLYTVTRDSNIVVAWRLYDVDDQKIIDDLRDMGVARSWSQEAEREADAVAALPDQFSTISMLGAEAGARYAARIAPTWITVSRSYYTKGSDELKRAKNYVKAGDWAGARAIWEGLISSPDEKVRGRAEFNLALAYEVDGYLVEALDMSRKAAVDLHNGRSRTYVTLLEQRVADMQRLQQQMPGPSEEIH